MRRFAQGQQTEIGIGCGEMESYRLTSLEQSEGGLSSKVGSADHIGVTASGGLILVGRADKAVGTLCDKAIDVGSEITVGNGSFSEF
jgi:hypothetical protein